MHLIVTPEYLRERARGAPRHASSTRCASTAASAPAKVLATVPGTHWDEERGLDEHQYIVPGAGGVGEILNNAWV